MSSAIIVCNFALSHLGVGKEIASLTERGATAEACNRFYETARDEMLRDTSPPWAKREAALGLITQLNVNDNHPTQEWIYSYRYPSDCLFARKILSGIRNDNRQSRVPYRFAADESAQLINTDREDAILEYISTLGQNPARWPPDFLMTLSYRLAAYIAPLVTGGDPFKVGQIAIQFWKMSLGKARANVANEEQDEDLPDSELIRARD